MVVGEAGDRKGMIKGKRKKIKDKREICQEKIFNA
jgi:hypothetical protein